MGGFAVEWQFGSCGRLSGFPTTSASPSAPDIPLRAKGMSRVGLLSATSLAVLDRGWENDSLCLIGYQARRR